MENGNDICGASCNTGLSGGAHGAKKEYDNQLRRQCFNIPVMCEEQIAGVMKGTAESVPAEVLKKIRRVIVTGCGDSYLAGIASIPAFKRYAGAFASHFSAVRCIEAARYMDYDGQQADETLVIGVSASGGPARLVEALKNAKRKGFHTVIVTNHPESPCGKEAEYSLIVNTPEFPEPGPGLRNYYASILGLFGLAAAMGEAKGICPAGTMAELMDHVRRFTGAYGECLERMDDQMFELAGTWRNHRAVETVGDSTAFATAYFVGAKYVEAAGMMAATADSEDWCHVNYFKHDPELLGVIVTAHGGEPNQSRVLETVSQAEAVGRPVLVVVDETKEEYGVAGNAAVCTVPKAPEGYEFLAPLLDYIPGTLLAAYVAAYREEPYFRGADSRQRQSAVGCTIRDSEIWVG